MPESKHRRRRGRALPRTARSAGSLVTSRPKRKKTNKFYLAASVIIAVLVIAGFAVGGGIFGGSGRSVSISTGSANQFVEGVGFQQELLGNAHVPTGNSVDYNTLPATSGDHWATPTACGFYEDGVADEIIVHNLEHGNIVVSYNLATESQVDELQQAIDDIGLANIWGVTRFDSRIPEGQVAVAAWGVLDTMAGVDQERLGNFFETYAGNLGPEGGRGLICSGLPRQHNR